MLFGYATNNRLVVAATLPSSKKSIHGSYALTDERGVPTVCLCLRYGNVSSPCGVGPPPFQIRHLHLSDTAWSVVSYPRKSQIWTFVVQFCDSLAYGSLHNISKMWSAIWRRQYALAATYPLPFCFAVISSPPGRYRTYRLQQPSRTEYIVALIWKVALVYYSDSRVCCYGSLYTTAAPQTTTS